MGIRGWFHRKSKTTTTSTSTTPTSTSTSPPAATRRILKIFKISSSRNSSDAHLQAQSHVNTVAVAPQVKGSSFTVAGIGPDVLGPIQESGAEWEERRASVSTISAADAPSIPLRREDIPLRPKTAPHNELPSGHVSSKSTIGRTFSGFSVKSPPSFLKRYQKDINITDFPPPEESTSPPLQEPAPRHVSVYQPARPSYVAGQTPSRVAHLRTESNSSLHVDVLDAYSTIKPSRETSQHRARAAGLRNYGEDVADRNIAHFGGSDPYDLSSPQFSYLRKIYNPLSHRHSTLGDYRRDSAFRHGLGDVLADYGEDEDNGSRQAQPARQAQAPRIAAGLSRVGAFPPRADSGLGYQTIVDSDFDVDSSPTTNGSPRSHAFSQYITAGAITDKSSSTAHRSESVNSARAVPIPARSCEPPSIAKVSSTHATTDHSPQARQFIIDNGLTNENVIKYKTVPPISSNTITAPQPVATECKKGVRRSRPKSANHSTSTQTRNLAIHSIEPQDDYDFGTTQPPSVSSNRESVINNPAPPCSSPTVSSNGETVVYNPLSASSSSVSSKRTSKEYHNYRAERTLKPVSSGKYRRASLGAYSPPSLEKIMDFSHLFDTQVSSEQLSGNFPFF